MPLDLFQLMAIFPDSNALSEQSRNYARRPPGISALLTDRPHFHFEPSIGSESDPETDPHPENFGLGFDCSRATSTCW